MEQTPARRYAELEEIFSEVEAPFAFVDLDAMWAQMESGVPTVNGYSGNFPAGWQLLNPNVASETPEELWRTRLDAWVARSGLDPARVCWVKVAQQEGPYRAVVVSQEVPERVAPGARAPVRVTVRNTGATAWTRQEAFRLGWAGPKEDASPWDVYRVELPHDVPPGGEVTFAFEVTAPPAPGRVPMRWRMLRELVRWFGEVTPEVEVAVDATAAAPAAP